MRRCLDWNVVLIVLVIVFCLNRGDKRRFSNSWRASIIRGSNHDWVVISRLHRSRVELLLGILVDRRIVEQACLWLIWIIFFQRPSKFECLNVILGTVKANWGHCKFILNDFWLLNSLVNTVLRVCCHRWLVCRIVLLRDTFFLHKLINTALLLFDSVHLGVAISLGYIWLHIWKFHALSYAFRSLRVNILLDPTNFLKDTLICEVLLFAKIMGVIDLNLDFALVNFVL